MGKVTEDKMLRLFHKGEKVAEVPADALAEEAPIYRKPSKEAAYFAEFQAMKMETPKSRKIIKKRYSLYYSNQQLQVKSGYTINTITKFAQAQLLRQVQMLQLYVYAVQKKD